MKNKISEWSIQNEAWKTALRTFQETSKISHISVSWDGSSTFDVKYEDVTMRFGVIYDNFNNPSFTSWEV